MGILGFISAFRSMRAAGDNFRFVAQNIATIYYVVDHSPFGATLNNSQKLYATALIDTYAYIAKGTISMEDVAKGVSYAQAGITVLFPFHRQHGMLYCNEHSDLVHLAMQIEAMIFSVDTNLHPNQIIEAVVSHKESIAEMITQTVFQGTSSPLYKNVLKKAAVHLQDPDFQHIVLVCEKNYGWVSRIDI